MPAAVMQLISSLGVGGAERLLIDYVTASAASERPQVVVVMNHGESSAFRRELEASGAPVHFLGRRPGALTPGVLTMLASLARQHRVGVVHSHNPGSMLWSCLLKAAAPSTKLVHTLHGEGAVDALTGLRRLAHRVTVAGTIAVSPAIATAAHRAGLPHVTQIDNGVALGRFEPQPPRALTGALRLTCIGRLAPEKGQDILVDALAICRAAGVTVQAHLIGDAESSAHLDDLKSRMRRHGLEEFVTLEHGRTDAPALLREADAFVLPSRSEGFGLALVEAMAAGVPIIAADTGGPGRILRDHSEAGLLFAPGSPEALAERIRSLATDEPLRHRLGAAGPMAAQSYAIERMVDRYETFYAAL